MTDTPRVERRRDLRISPKGTVIIRAEAFEIPGRVANLSRYGLAAITRTSAPQRLLGAKVELELRLDSQDSSWLALGGKVLRIGANSIAMYVMAQLMKPFVKSTLLITSSASAGV